MCVGLRRCGECGVMYTAYGSVGECGVMYTAYGGVGECGVMYTAYGGVGECGVMYTAYGGVGECGVMYTAYGCVGECGVMYTAYGGVGECGVMYTAYGCVGELVVKIEVLSTDAPGKLDVLLHDCDTFGVNCTEVAVFEEFDEVHLTGLLEGDNGGGGEAEIAAEILGDLFWECVVRKREKREKRERS
eukprot:3941487-Rhodomonas_salina.3